MLMTASPFSLLQSALFHGASWSALLVLTSAGAHDQGPISKFCGSLHLVLCSVARPLRKALASSGGRLLPLVSFPSVPWPQHMVVGLLPLPSPPTPGVNQCLPHLRLLDHTFMISALVCLQLILLLHIFLRSYSLFNINRHFTWKIYTSIIGRKPVPNAINNSNSTTKVKSLYFS